MNYLELCQSMRARAGISGTGPGSVVQQSGEMARVVGWVQQAWLDLQSVRPDWGPLWREMSVTVAPGARSVDPPEDFGISLWNRFAFDGKALGYKRRGEVRFDDHPGTPYAITDRPDVKFELIPAAKDGGVLTGEYYAMPQRLVADTDEPWAPRAMQDAIIYQAMMYYAMYEDAPEIYQDAQVKVQQYIHRMTNAFIPDPGMGGPIA